MRILTQPSEQADQGKLKPVPISLSKLRIPWLDATFREYDKGYILIQQHICTDYRIYLIRISFQHPCNCYIFLPQPGLGFISVLEGNLMYTDGNDKLQGLPEDMCAYMYVPKEAGCICVEGKPVMAMYIQVPDRLTDNILRINNCLKELGDIRNCHEKYISHKARTWTNIRIKERIKSIMNIDNRASSDNYTVFILIFNIISEYLYIQPKGGCGNYFSGQKSTLEAIKEKIEQEPHRQLTIQELANEYRVNRNQLSTSFRDTYGVHLITFIEACIMLRGKQLLRTTNYALKDISFELGFASGPAFTRSYTNYYGYNPIQERRGKKSAMAEK